MKPSTLDFQNSKHMDSAILALSLALWCFYDHSLVVNAGPESKQNSANNMTFCTFMRSVFKEHREI